MKKYNYQFLKIPLFLAALLGFNMALAQETTVSGTVTDAEDNSPLPGVNILVKGTTTGAITDFDGNFRINVTADEPVLVFSYIGYQTQEIPLNGQTSLDVQMAVDAQSLNEVVVVGYGTQEKKEITSAVASLDAEELNKGNVNDVGQLLQGKVPGLSIVRPGSNPNQGFNLRLRGLSSIGGNTQPLVVIDGVIGADLNSVDPNDIADISVLKDGSAAAIYGTRGSAGVILITTKSGKAGTAKIEYNGYVAAEEIAKTVEVASPAEFLENGINATDYGSETDWYDEITRTGITHVHNLALSGGSEQTSYRISMNYRDVEGIAEGVGFDQLNGRINLTQYALNNKLVMTMNLASTVRNSNFGFDEAFRYAAIYNPTAPVTSDRPADARFDGFFQEPLFDFFNPAAILRQNENDGRLSRLNLNFQAEYEILPQLKALARYSRNTENFTQGTYRDRNSFWVGADRNGLARRGTDYNSNELLEYTLNYQQTFGRLNVGVLGGYSYQYYNFEGHNAEGGDFITDLFTYNNLNAANDFNEGLGAVGSYRNDYELSAFFGRVNLNYEGTYFFSASMRREGSSRFGRNEKWGSFPALSAGVEISNLVDIPKLNSLKARASYGRTGALPGSSYLSLFRFSPRDASFFFNGTFIPVYGPSANPNANLRWELKDEYNFGIDFAAFNNRLTGSVDYFTRTTTDFIQETRVPQPPNQAEFTFLNVGEVNNSGLEAVMSYVVFDKPNFSWTPTVNFTTINTELVSLSTDDNEFSARDISNLGSPGQNGTPLIRIEEGQPVGQIWGLVYQGVDDAGNYIFEDVDGDGTVDFTADRAVIGQGLPDFEIGFNNSFTFGNFDLNMFFRGAFGHDLVNTYRAFYENPTVANTYNFVNTEFFQPEVRQEPIFSSYHVEDASFIRLDNATLGYNFELNKNSSFNRLRMYISGQNLFYITGYTGVDPEVRYSDGDVSDSNLAPGIDRRNTWARSRTYTFGVTLGF